MWLRVGCHDLMGLYYCVYKPLDNGFHDQGCIVFLQLLDNELIITSLWSIRLTYVQYFMEYPVNLCTILTYHSTFIKFNLIRIHGLNRYLFKFKSLKLIIVLQ